MMSIEKNEQTPRSVSILALGDTMILLGLAWTVFWAFAVIFDGEWKDSTMSLACGMLVYGHIMKLAGNIMEKLENAGY